MFEIVPGGLIEFLHRRNITPCPQEIRILTIKNTSSQRTTINVSSNSSFVDFGLAPVGTPPSLSGSVNFELEPNEERSVVVFFNCETVISFEATIFVDGVLLGEGGGAIGGTNSAQTIEVEGTIQ